MDSKPFGAALLAALALSGVSSTAWADPEIKGAPLGVYVGLNAGFAPSHRTCQGVADDACDHLSFGHKVYAGWHATNDVALEVSYLYFNGVNRDYTNTQNATISRERVSDRALALGIDWHIDLLNSVTNHLRVGVARAQRTTQTYYRNGAAQNFDDYKTVPYVGAGLGFSLNDYVQFNMAFDYIFNGTASRHLLSLGITSELPSDRRSPEFGRVYAGGAIGQGKVNISCDSSVSECKTSNTGGKLYVGSNISSNVAFEAGYLKLGSMTLAAGGANLNVKADALTLGFAGRYPIVPEFGVVGRVGMAEVRTKATASIGGASGETSSSDARLYWGYGVEYELIKDVKLTGSVDTTKATLLGDQRNVRLITVGAQTTF